ncbi:MAG TPA: M20/M25/M40 family metallo-hydrolase [Bacteroidales bacterium]
MIRFKHIFLLSFFIFSGSAVLSQSSPDITVPELEKHVYYLASDSLEGRKPGTAGGDEAARYIRDAFISYGLELTGDNGFQNFEVVTNVEPGKLNNFSFEEKQFEMGKDFMPMAISSNASVNADVVFAGFGFDIEEDSLNWNDYKNIDVAGKWVLVLRGDPEPDKDNSLFISYADDRSKALVARDKKVAGLILVSGPQFGDDKLADAAFNRVTSDAGMPVINITRAVADQIIKASGKTIDEIEKEIIAGKAPIAFDIKQTVSATTDMDRVKVTTVNVIGIIPGSDPVLKNEYVVIGAHYDHLGFGGEGSGSRTPDTIAVHNGADDNASGTAAILELAQKLSYNKASLKRSIVVMAFGAEEMGLLGSQFFTSNTLVDLKNIEVMFNFDMVGRLNEKERGVMVAGTGTAVEFDTLLSVYEQNSTLVFNHSPEGYGASDHASFYASGVPVLFFTTGAHPDYHTPADDANKINYKGEKDILNYAYPIIVDFANSEDPLTYQEAEPKKQEGRGGRGLKVKLGIMPDFTATENNGLGVGGVTAEGPAAKAGMQKGDKIVAIDGMSVTNIYDYMDRLKKLKPGQTISVDVVRDREHKVLVVIL